MSETVTLNTAKLNVTHPEWLQGEAAEPRTEPLRIACSRTQVMADALVGPPRTHGVVEADRSALAESLKMLRNQGLGIDMSPSRETEKGEISERGAKSEKRPPVSGRRGTAARCPGFAPAIDQAVCPTSRSAR